MADMLWLQFGITSQDVDDASAEAERSRRAAVIARSIASGSQLFLENRPPARTIRPGHCRHNRVEGKCVVRLSRPSCCGGVCVCVCVSARTRVAHDDVVRLQECGGSQICPHNRRKSDCKVGAPPVAAAAVDGVFACV